MSARRGSARRSGVLFALAILLGLLAFLAGGPRAAAQEAPVDVGFAPAVGPRRALDDAPADFAVERQGEVTWEYPRAAARAVGDLQDAYRETWPRLGAELGVTIREGLTIRIGRNVEQMRALAPSDAPPPDYAVGVAYPHRDLVVLTLTEPTTGERPDIEGVLAHELSHIALYRALETEDGRSVEGGVPRWFAEGLAIYQAREASIERARALWGGTVGGRLLTLEQLSGSFPSRPNQVNLAYAQSADFVRWLRNREDGERKFREVIHRLREGQPFETALMRTFSTNLTRLEIDWHDDLASRYQAWPLLLGSGGLWVFGALLLVIAYIRRKRKDRIKLAQWEREEREAMEERIAAAASAQALDASRLAAPLVTAPIRSRLIAPRSASADGALGVDEGEEAEVLYVVPPEPIQRDSQIPTVEHDGRSHTLH
ncbi:MAG: hypothetical protein AB7S26_06335 [Sandaracinaceae bacterium]